MGVYTFCWISLLLGTVETCNLDFKIHKTKTHAIIAVKIIEIRLVARGTRLFFAGVKSGSVLFYNNFFCIAFWSVSSDWVVRFQVCLH